MYTVHHLSSADAMKVIEAIRTEVEKNNQGVAIAVTDAHGELMAFLRTEGCPLASINNAINKAFTAARERKESRAVGDAARAEGWNLTNFGDLHYTGWGGGAPLVHQGEVIGGVGVSGLPEAEDMVLARLGAQALA